MVKIDFDVDAVMDKVKEQAKDHLENERLYDVKCPHCDKDLTIKAGKSNCPECNEIIDLKLNINYE